MNGGGAKDNATTRCPWAAARALLPKRGATLEDALLAAMLSDALRGDAQARRDLLARVWPAPKPVEVSAGDGVGRTLADLLLSIRDEPNEPAEAAET